jgi:DNA-binding XRE family transcriptional regulator
VATRRRQPAAAERGARGAGRSGSSAPKTPATDDPPGAIAAEQALGRHIAERVRVLRRQLGLSISQLATSSGISKGMLSKLENGQVSPSLATLVRISAALDAPVTSLFRGLDEEGDVMLVKAGQGMDISHRGSRAGSRYQLLGDMRGPHKKMEPVLVTLLERMEIFPLYQHPGTELLYMLSGRMDYSVGAATYTLEPGDALQFDGEVPHGPCASVALPVQFLSIKAFGPGSG